MLKCKFCGEKPAKTFWHGKVCCDSCYKRKRYEEKNKTIRSNKIKK